MKERYNAQQLMKLVRWIQGADKQYYYVVVVDGPASPNAIEKDQPYGAANKLWYYDEEIFQKLLFPYLDWSDIGWLAVIDEV